MAEIGSEKAQTPAPTAASAKRAKTIGGLAVVAGLIAGVLGLVNVLAGKQDIVDILLVLGGLLACLAGLRVIRRARAG